MSIFTGISKAWSTFEGWVAKITPGIKTELVALLGGIGNLAAAGQEYITNVPTNKFITGEQIMLANFVFFTLAFWLRNISSRVAANP